MMGYLGLRFLDLSMGDKETTIIFRAIATGDVVDVDPCGFGGGCIVVASTIDDRVYIYDPVHLEMLAHKSSGPPPV